jgi:prepilin peptidase CpaA
VRTDHLTILSALLAVACASDVATRRVPNVLVIAIAVTGAFAQFTSGGFDRALAGIAGGAGILALFLLAWATGKLGGGDLKLAAATAVWLSPSKLVPFVLFTAMAGLPVALAAWGSHRLQLFRVSRGAAASGDGEIELAPARPTVPLSVAIALGAGAALWGLR